MRIGVVAFAGTAAVVQAPTLSRDDVIAAIDRFQLQRGTAIGSGIVLSLATSVPGRRHRPVADHRPAQHAAGAGRQAEAARSRRCTPGSYTSAAIILLTDGQRTTGPDPVEAAKMAAERGVRVYTVGIGTKEGETIGFEGWSMRVRLDEETLKSIANITRADYFYAGTAADLKKVYQGLTPAWWSRRRRPRSARCSPRSARCSSSSPPASRCGGSGGSPDRRPGAAKACVVHCAAARYTL